MKKIIPGIILFLPLFVFSQSNFEGTITYRIRESRGDVTFNINMYYGKNKLKMGISGQSKPDSPDDAHKIMQFDFEKGLSYSIDTMAKVIEVDSLKFAGFDDVGVDFIATDSIKVIQGYNCRLYRPKTKNEDEHNYFSSGNELSIWFAEDIKYIIPKEYINKRSLIATDNGNTIWVKFSFIISMSFELDKKISDTITSELIRIEKKALPDDIFNLPSNYIISYKTPDDLDEIAVTDSVTARELTLTELKQEEVKKPEPPPPPPPKESKPIKSPAKKSKATKPVKG